MIKLSDLKAVRSKMEPGPYTHEPCAPIAEWVRLDTALGIEATHAAADREARGDASARATGGAARPDERTDFAP
jgi:hypothetical protein